MADMITRIPADSVKALRVCFTECSMAVNVIKAGDPIHCKTVRFVIISAFNRARRSVPF